MMCWLVPCMALLKERGRSCPRANCGHVVPAEVLGNARVVDTDELLLVSNRAKQELGHLLSELDS